MYVRNVHFGVSKMDLQRLLHEQCGLALDAPLQVIRKPDGRAVNACSFIVTCESRDQMLDAIDTINRLPGDAVAHVLAPSAVALEANEAYIVGARSTARAKAAAAPAQPIAPTAPKWGPRPPTTPPPAPSFPPTPPACAPPDHLLPAKAAAAASDLVVSLALHSCY